LLCGHFRLRTFPIQGSNIQCTPYQSIRRIRQKPCREQIQNDNGMLQCLLLDMRKSFTSIRKSDLRLHSLCTLCQRMAEAEEGLSFHNDDETTCIRSALPMHKPKLRTESHISVIASFY
jgi:hypothetical protein